MPLTYRAARRNQVAGQFAAIIDDGGNVKECVAAGAQTG
jgi:hypothetical protein